MDTIQFSDQDRVLNIKAIFFWSIGTIAETSHLQLKAFNAAFEFHKLDWHWSREAYAKMLKLAGGEKRIETYALLKNEIVDAKKYIIPNHGSSKR